MMRQLMSLHGGVTDHGVTGFLAEMNHGIHNGYGGSGVAGDGDLSDDGSQMLGEKKKRLSMEQVKALERSFETGNKLEPERKAELARSLGLHPRQVAIWFQNRRARWKTKQIERDYDVLKRQLEILKADNDSLQSQNEKLHDELMAIKARELNESLASNVGKRPEGSSSYWSNHGSSDISCDINLDISRTSVTDSLREAGAVDEQRAFWQWTVAADQHHLHD